MSEVSFDYGIASAPLEKQANAQGYTLGKNAAILEKCKIALTLVRVNQLVSCSQCEKGFVKLNRKVVDALTPMPTEDAK